MGNKEYYFDKQFELMEEIIYNPKVNNNSFDVDSLLLIFCNIPLIILLPP